MKTITTWWPKEKRDPHFPEACCFCNGPVHRTVTVHHPEPPLTFKLPYCEPHHYTALDYRRIVRQEPAAIHSIWGWVAAGAYVIVVMLLAGLIFGSSITGLTATVVVVVLLGGGIILLRGVPVLLSESAIQKQLRALDESITEIGLCLGISLEVFPQATATEERLDFRFHNDEYAASFESAQSLEALDESP